VTATRSHSSLTRFLRVIIFFAAASLSAQTVPIDLSVNGQPQGSISCQIAGTSISVEKAKLIEAVKRLVDPKVLDSITGMPPFINTDRLKDLGIDARFDSNNLRLELNVAPSQQVPQILSVGTAGPPATTEKIAALSGYLNLRASLGLLTAPETVFVPGQFIAQPVLNYRGWVLDASTTVSTGSVSLDYARVSHDFVASNQRLTIGSLFSPVTGFMTSRSCYGVEFFADPKMTANLHDLHLVTQQFILSQPGTVNMLLNSGSVGAYHLNAGRYVIPNLPFMTGLNEIIITSDNGLAVQRVIPYDSRLLPENEMSYSAGLEVPQWMLQPPILSGFFLYGVTPYLTVGAFTQDDMGNQMQGVEATYATPIGNFHSQLGISEGTGIDFAAEIDYRLAFGYGAYYPTVSLAAQYTGQYFLAPGIASNLYSWNLAASVSQPLPLLFSVGLGFSYQFGWYPNPDMISVSFTAARPIGKEASINFILSATQQMGGPAQVQASIMLSSILYGGRESTFATTSLISPQASADFHYQPAPSLPSGTFSISKDGEMTSGNADLQYTTPFIDSTLADSFAPSSNNLLISAGVAIVMAGGAFGVTRPVSDSFAIIVPRDNMAGQTVYANQTPDTYDGVSMAGLNIGLSQLSSYTRSTVTLSSPTAPVDSNMGPLVRFLSPTYKSGSVIVVGSKATISVSGKLVANGKPLGYRAGKFGNESFFTDEDGSFQVYDLTAGTWTLTIDGTDIRIDVTVPASRQYDAGTIEVGK
jgi:outer membrane usher protein